ncbi:MAG: anti-sigma factor antagonist [Planctomycetota bacterium]|nr:MAG: anti-sigma factor antagonist [Planctomycetota bacterium]
MPDHLPATVWRLPAMAMHPYPVVLPYQAGGGDALAVPTLAISAAATNPRNAVAVANAFINVSCMRRYGYPAGGAFLDRARVGPAGTPISGPYAYVLGPSNRIPIIPFPQRLDHQSCRPLQQRIQGLRAGGADTLIVDAAQLTFLDSSALSTLGGLASISSQNPGLHLHLFRPSPPIRKVFEIVGLDRMLGIHETLVNALTVCASQAPIASP